MRYIALLFLSFMSLSLQALDFKSPFKTELEFLPVEQAFPFSFTPKNDGRVELIWEISEGYYLYQHQFKVQEVSNTNSNIRFAPLPQGKEKNDPYFGDVVVYRDQLKAQLLYDNVKAGTEISINLSYQGCADRGLCYPPQTLPLKIVATETSTSQTNTAAKNVLTQNNLDLPPPSQASYVINLLTESSLFVSIATLFGLGLLLSLTPCVLPMVPIVSAIVIDDKTSDQNKSPWRGFYYSALYVLAMAGTYASFGALAGYFGTQLNLQAHLQNPAIIAFSVVIFIALALAMFGVYELKMPSFIQNKLSNMGNSDPNSSRKNKSISVIVMGVLATLIVSPCVSAPLAGIIFFISTQGDAVYGAVMLFVMALGMGVPLLLVGIFGAKVLPKSGQWLNDIKVVMGFGLLAVAIWLLGRWNLGSYLLYLWSTFFIFFGAYFWTRHRSIQSTQTNVNNPIRFGLAIIMLIFGFIQAIGAASGSKDMLMPLERLSTSSGQQENRELTFATVYSLSDLSKVIQTNTANKIEQKPILLDLYADWCISCKIIEEEIFLAHDVFPLLEQFILVKADVTKNSLQNQELMNHYQLYGPPSLLFFAPNGEIIDDITLIGEPSKQEVIDRLMYALQHVSK